MYGRSTLKAAARTLVAFAIAGGFAALATGGCNMVSGLDSLTQAASIDDGGSFDGGPSNLQVAGEGGVVSGPTTSTCTPDPAFCNTHCGAAKDNCGQPRTCGNCGESSTCDPATNTCQCAVSAGFCTGRCGTATDNCTHQEDCGGCDGGTTCSAGGACGCNPDPVATSCGSQQCGHVTNNCNQTVFCGGGGTANCAKSGDFCKADNTCCTPDNVTPCAGKCNTTAVNNCGQTISCSATCGTGQACNVTTCCTPDAIATTCAGACNGTSRVNNCGQTVVCESCTGVCDSTTNTCCSPLGYCTNGHECGSGQNNCHQTISCGNCIDQCAAGGGTCQVSGFCMCRCGAALSAPGDLGTQQVPCLPE